MTRKKPDIHILTVWRIRLLLLALVPSFISAMFASHINWVWWVFSAAWMLAFLYFYIFYYPIKYRKLSYFMNPTCLLVHCGVIYTRVKAMPFASIQYTSIASTPLERLFGLRSLLVFAAGAGVYIPGLLPLEAERLRGLLSPADDEGGATA